MVDNTSIEMDDSYTEDPSFTTFYNYVRPDTWQYLDYLKKRIILENIVDKIDDLEL